MLLPQCERSGTCILNRIQGAKAKLIGQKFV